MVIEKDLKSEVIELAKQEVLHRVPASEQEFFTLATQLPFKIEYHQSELIIIGLASYVHELILINLAGNLMQLFKNDSNVTILGSSLGVKTDKFEGSYFLPDVTLVKGKPEFAENTNSIIKNPSVVFEVLSPSTKNYDLSEKLEEYKTFESLEKVVFVYQDKMKVTSYTRCYEPVGWFNQDLTNETDYLVIEEEQLALAEIYNKVTF